MNILYVCNARIPTEKAHGVHIMSMCEAFASHGANVQLLVPWRVNPLSVDPFTFYSVRPIFRIKRLFSIDLTELGPIGSYIQEITFVLSAILYVAFLRTRPKSKNTIIYIRGERLFRSLTLWFPGAKIYHESHVKHGHFAKYVNAYKRATGTVVVTRYYANELIAAGFGRDRVLWAPDGVDIRHFDPNPNIVAVRQSLDLPPDAAIIGYVGKLTTLEHGKGVEELAEAFARVHKERRSAFLLIVGANQHERAPFEEYLRSLGLHPDSYRIIEHVPRATAAKYMQACTIVVMNYPNAEHYAHYMSPLKLFEYMASGATIVTSDLPSVRDILNESNASLVPADDTGRLASAIHHLLDNQDHSRALAAQARADVEQYTWEKRAQHILALIERTSYSTAHKE